MARCKAFALSEPPAGGLFVRAPRHLCAQDPARDAHRSLVLSPEPHHVQRVAGLSRGPAAGNPGRARGGGGTRGAGLEPSRSGERASHRCGRTSGRDAMGAAPGAAGPSRPGDRHRIASPSARSVCRRGRGGTRPAPQRSGAASASHPGRRATPGAARAIGVSPSPTGPDETPSAPQHKMGPDPPARPS